MVCWAASIVPLVVAFLTLLCDVDGECTPADTTTRRIGLTIAVLLWLASGPAAKAVSGKKWFMLASVIPFLLALPLLPYFIAGP